MPLNETLDDIENDYEILEAVGRHVDDLIKSLLPLGALRKTLQRWLNGHAEPPEYEDAWKCLAARAADLELFTPSMSGRTAVDRHLNASRPETQVERQALQALGAAQFRLVRIAGREGPDLVRLKDLVTGESLLLLDARISPHAADLTTAMRLCPLTSGRHVLISPLFMMDEAMLAAATTFVRPGRPLGNGHRCAASLYRDVARRGFLPIPQLPMQMDAAAVIDEALRLDDRLTEVERLAFRWIEDGRAEEAPDLILEARRLASVDNLVDACGFFGLADAGGPKGLRAAFERIAALQMETIAERALAGVTGHAEALDRAAAAIADSVARGVMEADAHDLFVRLKKRWASSASAGPAGSAAADLDRVIQRIRALRAKTVDHGCTEEEAIAAAAKVAELLDRHDLTLDEVSIRSSDCEGASVATGRKRRAPVDSCMRPLAEFCDCRAWSEEGDDDAFCYVFFGLKADVEAARFLNDLIEVTFETESTAFRNGEIYLALRGGDRRTALNSFQVGLASGIVAKLATLKAARHSSAPESTGFDLVAAKHSVVDEEIARLGLNFTTRTTTTRRYVHGAAYAAGKAAGALLNPMPPWPADWEVVALNSLGGRFARGDTLPPSRDLNTLYFQDIGSSQRHNRSDQSAILRNASVANEVPVFRQQRSYAIAADSTLPHSHSIVLSDDNALIYQRNFFLHMAKKRLADPSKIRALDFKGEFRQSAICSVSATIDINRSNFLKTPRTTTSPAGLKKTVSADQDVIHSQASSSCSARNVRSSPFITRPATLTHHSDTSVGLSWMSSAFGMIRNHAAAKTRMPLPFEAIQAAFKLIDSLSERGHVVAHRIVDAFQRFDEAHNPGP